VGYRLVGLWLRRGGEEEEMEILARRLNLEFSFSKVEQGSLGVYEGETQQLAEQ
jgi:hypothetical protein